MSFSAYVICNCYKDGKTTEPPYKEYLTTNEDEIAIHLPNPIWDDEDLYLKMHNEFDEWKSTACEHPEMDFSFEHLTNNSGMSAFRHMIHRFGGIEKYPILTQYLPTTNEGTLPAECAHKALQELNLLELENTLEQLVILKEKSQGIIIAAGSIDKYHPFIFNGPFTFAIHKNVFFILENVKNDEKQTFNILFQSTHFSQEIWNDSYKYIDKQTGHSFKCPVQLHPIEDECLTNYDFLVTFEQHTIAYEYGYLLEPLKKLANASIITGNPIHWT